MRCKDNEEADKAKKKKTKSQCKDVKKEILATIKQRKDNGRVISVIIKSGTRALKNRCSNK